MGPRSYPHPDTQNLRTLSHVVRDLGDMIQDLEMGRVFCNIQVGPM